MIVHHDLEQGSDEWLAERMGCITGSRFVDCRGFSDGLTDQQRTYVQHILHGEREIVAREMAGYKAAPTSEAVARCIKERRFVKVWDDTACRYAKDVARERCGGRAPGKYQTRAMREGREQESIARMRYETLTGHLVREVGIFKTDDGLFGVSPDGLIGDDGALEIKTMVSSETLFTAVADGDVSEYIDQCNGYLWMLGRKWVDLVLWCPDFNQPVIRRIERDDDAIEALESDLIAFAGLVKGYEAALTTALAKGKALPAAAGKAICKPSPKAKPAATTVTPKTPAAAPAPVAVALPDLF